MTTSQDRHTPKTLRPGSRIGGTAGLRAARPPGGAPLGFTLLELVVVIGIVAVMSAALIPFLVTPKAQARVNETIAELEVLREAIQGDPEAGDWGYLGTMGELPAADTDGVLTPLVQQDSQPDPGFGGLVGTNHEDGWGGVALGWNGPYVRKISPSPLHDGWGQPYVIETHSTETWRYRLRSGGPDKDPTTTADNIEFPSTTTWYVSHAQVSLHLQYMSSGGHWLTVPDGWLDASEPNGPVQVRYPKSGLHCEVGSTCEAYCVPVNGQCLLEDSPGSGTPFRLPFGRHVVRVVLDPATSLCTPGVTCEHIVTFDVRQPVVQAPVRIPNPAPIGLPMSVLGCIPNAAANVDTTAAPLCTVATASLTVPVGTNEERVVQLQASGEWQALGTSSGCRLQIEHVPPLGPTVTLDLARFYWGSTTPGSEYFPFSGSFTEHLTAEGDHVFRFLASPEGAGCHLQARRVGGIAFVQRP